MATITQEIYNGKDWIRITAEEVLNNQGEPTGHYQEISREYVSKFGIFDDVEQLKIAIETFNKLKSQYRHNFYLLHGEEYYYIFRAYSSSSHKSFGDAVVAVLEKIGLPQDFYDIQLDDGTTGIEIVMRQRDPERIFLLQLIPADNFAILTP